MKKRSLVVLSLVIVLALAFALVACGGNDTPKADNIKKVIANAENDSVAYIENVLRGDDYKSTGAMYEDTSYDQYVMILARSKKGLDEDIKTAYMARVKDVMAKYINPTDNKVMKFIPPAYEGDWGQTLDYTTNIVTTLLAMGESTVVDGVDLAAPFYDATFAINSNKYTYYNNIVIVKSLTIPANYTTKDGVSHASTTTLDALVSATLATQKEGGSWETDELDANWEPTGKKVFDVDYATWAMRALATLDRTDAITSAINAVTSDIKANLLDTGSIKYFGASNISGSAVAISALATNGVDARGIKAKGSSKDMLDYVLSMKSKEKGAYALTANGDANFFATKDAVVALIDYNRMNEGKSSFFSFK